MSNTQNLETTLQWHVHEVPTDALEWSSSWYPWTVCATPFFDGQEGIIVQVDNMDGETLFNTVIEWPEGDRKAWEGGLVPEDAQWVLYWQKMRKEFPHILQQAVYENT